MDVLAAPQAGFDLAIETVAGTGDKGFSGDDGPATEAQLAQDRQGARPANFGDLRGCQTELGEEGRLHDARDAERVPSYCIHAPNL